MKLFTRKKRVAQAERTEPQLERPADAGIFEGNPSPTMADAYIKRLEAECTRKGILNGVLIGALVASMATSGVVVRQYRPDVRLVRFGDPVDRTYVLQPGQIQGTDRDLYIQTALKDYVVNREMIDHTTEQQRDNWLRLYTDPTWWKVYQEFINPNNPQNPRVDFAKKLTTREIQVLYVTRGSDQQTYQVFYIAISRRAGQIVAQQEWVATMQIYQRGMVFQGQEYEANPLGLAIANYSIQSRYGEDARR